MNGSGCSSWPTVCATEPEQGENHQRNRLTRAERGGGAGPSLATTAALWPTPMAGTPARNGNSAAGNSDFSRRADELAASLWATPAGSLMGYENDPEVWDQRGARLAAKGLPRQGVNLGQQSQLWQTIVADDRMDRDRGKVNSRGEPKLSGQAALWATPIATEYEKGNLTRGEGSKGSQVGLTMQVHRDYTCRSPLPARMTAPDGPPSSTWRPISRRLFRSAMSGASPTFTRRMLRKGGWRKRRLNPAFVEWLMAWPEGHARSGCSETAFILWRRRMRGALSRLPSASGPWIWEERMEPETPDLFALPCGRQETPAEPASRRAGSASLAKRERPA